MRQVGLVGLYVLSALVLAACGSGASDEVDESAVRDECSGHGDLHGDHCDCEAGYELDPDDETRCIKHDEHDEHAEHEQEDGPAQAGRLLVSDGVEGRVVVVDLALGEAIASLATEGAARVYPSSDGMRGFAVQGSANGVQAIESGVEYSDHGDHFDAKTTDPSVVSELVVACERPVHFVAHDGHAATFCDGDGMLHVFDDRDLRGREVTRYDSGRAHHGVGLVGLGHVLLSIPNPDDPEDALPVGVRALAHDGDEHASFEQCPLLHGEAATDTHVCFGCGDGVMCVTDDGDSLRSVKIDNPEGTEETTRVGTLVASGEVLVGNWGQDLARIDPVAGSLTPLPVGAAYLTFALSEDGHHVVLLTDSGKLLKLDVDDGTIEGELELLPAFEREPGHGQLRPTLVLGPARAYVVDPRHAEVYEVELESMALSERAISLDAGEYHSLALVALPPA